MKSIRIIITVVIFLLPMGMSAQSKEDIQQVRKWYYATKKKIDISKKTKGGYFGCDVVETNVHKIKGYSHIKKEFWYNNESECIESPSACLEMVIMTNDNSYNEFCYHNGNLIFVYIKDHLNEFRFYFKNDKLIKEIKGTKVGEGMYYPEADDVKRAASIYSNQFQMGFGVPND